MMNKIAAVIGLGFACGVVSAEEPQQVEAVQPDNAQPQAEAAPEAVAEPEVAPEQVADAPVEEAAPDAATPEVEPGEEPEAAEEETAASDEESATQYTAEQRLAYAKCVALLSEAALGLESVTDKDTADAAATTVNTAMEAYDGYQELLGESLLAAAVKESGWDSDAAEALADVFYYGSTALAEALGQDATAAEEPAAVPQALVEGLAAQLAMVPTALVQYAEVLGGGPGVSSGTAWVVRDRAEEVTAALYPQLLAALADYEPETLSSKNVAGEAENQFFAVWRIVLNVEGQRYLLEQWVDVSVAFSAEKREQAMVQMAQLQEQMNAVLGEIKDKASATQAVEKLSSMIEQFNACEGIVAAMSDEEYAAAAEKHGYDAALKQSEELLEKLEEMGFYGSEELSEMFYW